MKKAMLMILLLLVTAVKTKAQDRPKDEVAIKQCLARFGNSWAKTDFSDMKDYMTPDCNWINVVGMHWHNLKEVQYAHQTFVGGFFKNVQTKEVSTNIRFITKDVAVVYWRTHIGAFYPPDGVDRGVNKQGDKDNLATLILIKQNDKWLITSAQNNDVISQAAASDPVLHMKN